HKMTGKLVLRVRSFREECVSHNKRTRRQRMNEALAAEAKALRKMPIDPALEALVKCGLRVTPARADGPRLVRYWVGKPKTVPGNAMPDFECFDGDGVMFDAPPLAVESIAEEWM